MPYVVHTPMNPATGRPGEGSLPVVIAGTVFWVDSGHANRADEPSHGRAANQPFATLDYAIGQTTASNGDLIYVAPGHAETLSADSAVDVDVAGLTIVGLGRGASRPTFTFATAAAADFKLAAAGVSIHNLVFVCNIASQDMMIETTADDVEIANCEFREGTATGLTFITIGVADGDSDRAYVHDCTFYMPTAGNGDAAISIAFDMNGVRLERNRAFGDYDLATIDVPAGGDLNLNLLIKDNILHNSLTGQHAIQVSGTTCTGHAIDNRVFTDAIATSIDPGGLGCAGNLWNLITDSDFEGIPPNPAADQVTNFIGVDDSNNAAATTNVAANEDGSILERLEQIQEAVNVGTGTSLAANESLVDVLYAANGIAVFPAALAPANGVSIAEALRYVSDIVSGVSVTRNPILGIKVNKTAATLPATTTQNIFTVSGGRVLVTSLTGEVTTVVQAQPCNLSANHVTTVGGDIVIASTVEINADEAGTLYVVEGDGTALVPQSSGAVLASSGSGPMILAEGTINIQTSATSTGATAWELWYFPLDSGASVASA